MPARPAVLLAVCGEVGGEPGRVVRGVDHADSRGGAGGFGFGVDPHLLAGLDAPVGGPVIGVPHGQQFERRIHHRQMVGSAGIVPEGLGVREQHFDGKFDRRACRKGAEIDVPESFVPAGAVGGHRRRGPGAGVGAPDHPRRNRVGRQAGFRVDPQVVLGVDLALGGVGLRVADPARGGAAVDNGQVIRAPRGVPGFPAIAEVHGGRVLDAVAGRKGAKASAPDIVGTGGFVPRQIRLLPGAAVDAVGRFSG